MPFLTVLEARSLKSRFGRAFSKHYRGESFLDSSELLVASQQFMAFLVCIDSCMIPLSASVVTWLSSSVSVCVLL